MSGEKILQEQGTALGALQVFSPFEMSKETLPATEIEDKKEKEETPKPETPAQEPLKAEVVETKASDEDPKPNLKDGELQQQDIAASADFSSYSVPSKLALSMQKTHGYLSGDAEIKEDMSFEQLFEMINESAEGKASKKIEGLYESEKLKLQQKFKDEGLDISYARQNAHLANGGSPQVVSAYHQYKAVADHTPDTDEQKEGIIRTNLIAQGQRADLVDQHIEHIPDEESLDRELAQAQKELAEVAEGLLKQDEEKIAQQKAGLVNLRVEAKKELSVAVTSTDLPFKIPKREHDSLVNYLGDFNKVVQGHDGIRREMTGFQEDMYHVMADPPKLIALAKIMKMGVGPFIDMINKGAGENFMNSLEDEDISKTITAEEIENPKPRAGKTDKYLDNLEKLQESGVLLGIL